jgi:hypothetical protein
MHAAQTRGRNESVLRERNQKDTSPVVGLIACPSGGSTSCSPLAKSLGHNYCQLNWQLEWSYEEVH